jgi:hypothetical protein
MELRFKWGVCNDCNQSCYSCAESAGGVMNYGFYVKCRPQRADIQTLALKYNRVFIGYPAWRKGAPYNRHKMQKCLLDISVSASDWKTAQFSDDLNGGYRRQVMGNRNFVLETAPGDFVVLPRPGEGVCYIGKVDEAFGIVNDPSWADEYLDLRIEQKLGERKRELGVDQYRGIADEESEDSHIADVVQSWHVEKWVGIAFPLLPRWITYSLLSRNTKGWLCDRPDGCRTALEVLDEIYQGRYSADLSPTCDVRKAAGRMLDWLSPNAFEHLACELLQLEQPEIRWWHVGGSGDGGADGLAVNDKGYLVAALQCKWKDAGDANALAANLKERISSKWGKDVRVYVATLYDALPESQNPGVIFLDRIPLAGLLVKHAECCGIAKTLRVVPKK